MPPDLKALGLTTSIENLIYGLEKLPNSPKMSFSTNINKKTRFNCDFELALFRITQEIINNTLKHAQAKNFQIDLIGTKKEITLNTIDNGIGFKTEKYEQRKGIGLTNLVNKIKFLNGTFSIQSYPKEGTSIAITIPIKKK